MTARQFYLTIIIFTFTLKIQKLPCLIYNKLGKDSIILVLLYFVIDLLGLIVVYLLAQKTKEKKYINTLSSSRGGKFTINFLSIFFCIYFFLQAAIFFEAIQDLFSHILFDNLSWTLFSLFLLFAIYLLAVLDLKVIGRNIEIYFYIIIVSVLILIVTGGFQTDFMNIFPLQTIPNNNYFQTLLEFNMWFGDYILVFFLSLHSKDTTLKKTLISYIVSMVIVLILYYIYYGIYLGYSGIQPSLITVISEQSLLGVELGRPDWFCILLIEIGSVLSSAMCFNFSEKFARNIFPKAKKHYVLAFLIIAMYLLDIIYLVDFNAKETFFLTFLATSVFVLKVVFFAVLIIASIYFCSKREKKQVKYEN